MRWIAIIVALATGGATLYAQQASPQGTNPDGGPPQGEGEVTSDPGTSDPGTFGLGEDGGWVKTDAPAPGSDEAFMAQMRTFIAQGSPSRAAHELSKWIRAHRKTDNPYLAEAYLLRGDARSTKGNEYLALYDYERVCRNFPSSPHFVTAVERELAIGIAYLHGMDRLAFGFRIAGAERTGEKLLIRVDERMPFSQLAETAGIELADYYYRKGELGWADTSYEMFLRFHPVSRFRRHALLRRVYCTIGQFKGPKYDASMLADALLLIDDFKAEYPAEAQRLGIARALPARIIESQAAQKLDKARWYLKRSDGPSARFVLRRVLRDFPSTTSAGVALDIMRRHGWGRTGGREEHAEGSGR